MSLQGVRTKTVKKSARQIIEQYYSRLTLDFHSNKRVVDEVSRPQPAGDKRERGGKGRPSCISL